MERIDFHKLHDSCGEKLERFIRETRAMLALLRSITLYPVPHEVRRKIQEQRLRENDAQAQFSECRHELLALTQKR